MRRGRQIGVAIVLLAAIVALGCGKKKPAIPQPAPAPTTGTNAPAVPTPPPAPPQRVDDALPVPPQPIADDSVANRSLDDLNRDSPLKPVFFSLDSADLDDAGRAAASANAEVLKKYVTWVVTIEGHCDERGTAEYNLALGERRANAVRDYLASRGIGANRLRTVSYGEERPKFDNGREETRRLNRRAALVVRVQ